MCTSVAPARRSISTTRGVVVPRTIESSTTTTRLPSSTSRSGLNFRRTPRSRTCRASSHRLSTVSLGSPRPRMTRLPFSTPFEPSLIDLNYSDVLSVFGGKNNLGFSATFNRTINNNVINEIGHRTAAGNTDAYYVPAAAAGAGTPVAQAPATLPKYRPELLAKVKDISDRQVDTDTVLKCMPPGVPRMDTSNSETALHPFKIVQTPSLVVLLYETSSNSTFRQVFLDGRPLPKDPQPSWLGYSIGKWEGSTLVVTTTGFNGREWIDTYKGHPQSDAAIVTERFTRRDYGHMDLEITIDDPKTYTEPWTSYRNWYLQPDWEILEYSCEENNRSLWEGRIKIWVPPGSEQPRIKQ